MHQTRMNLDQVDDADLNQMPKMIVEPGKFFEPHLWLPPQQEVM